MPAQEHAHFQFLAARMRATPAIFMNHSVHQVQLAFAGYAHVVKPLMLVQKLLTLWPSLLVGNALTVQQSMCVAQPTTDPPYIQSASPRYSSVLANLIAGVQEEFATMLR